MRKLLIIFVCFILLGCSSKDKLQIKSLDEFKKVKVENIISIEKTTLNEAGQSNITIKDKKKIKSIYNKIYNISIKEESDISCLDDTRYYKFNLKDNKTYVFEFECSNIVINGKRYSY